MDKLTIAEINLLRDEAEKERATHRSILKEISSYECIWKENGLDTMPEELQLQILKNQARYVKPGGVLLYSTCTLVRKENFYYDTNNVAGTLYSYF